jgi:hypothetical protein
MPVVGKCQDNPVTADRRSGNRREIRFLAALLGLGAAAARWVVVCFGCRRGMQTDKNTADAQDSGADDRPRR